MDGCPRQNPAYRLATEEAPQGASFYLPGPCGSTVATQQLLGTVDRLRKIPVSQASGHSSLTPVNLPEAPAGEQLERLGVARPIGVVEQQIAAGPHLPHRRFQRVDPSDRRCLEEVHDDQVERLVRERRRPPSGNPRPASTSGRRSPEPAASSRSLSGRTQYSLSSKLITWPARRANQTVERPEPSSRIVQSCRIRLRSQPTDAGTIQGRSGVGPLFARHQAAG